jgi:hypothetical protein
MPLPNSESARYGMGLTPFQRVSAHTKKQPWEGGSAIGDGWKWSSVMTEDWR